MPPVNYQVDPRVLAALERYLTQREPLGPAENESIADPELAAYLYEPRNDSFSRFAHSPTIVLGRRGSGKTALLSSLQYHRFSRAVRDRLKVVGDLRYDPAIHSYSVDTAELLSQMETFSYTEHGQARHGEVVAAQWRFELYSVLLDAMHEDSRLPAQVLDECRHCRHQIDTSRERALEAEYDGQRGAKTESQATTLIAALLARIDPILTANHHPIYLLVDSLDSYDTRASNTQRAIGSLCRVAKAINADFKSICVVVALPLEIYPDLIVNSENAGRDYVFNSPVVRWSARELVDIATRRLGLFLMTNGYEDLRGRLQNPQANAQDLWRAVFPNDIKNRYGHNEPALTYILRHTQLQPRQVIRALNGILAAQWMATGAPFPVEETYIRNYTDQTAEHEYAPPQIVLETIQAYNYTYPYAQKLIAAGLMNLPTTFHSSQIEEIFRRKVYRFVHDLDRMLDENEYLDMLKRMGVVGHVVRTTEKYVVAEFGYALETPPPVYQEGQLAIHPIFSRWLGCKPNAEGRAVLPVGSDDYAGADNRGPVAP